MNEFWIPFPERYCQELWQQKPFSSSNKCPEAFLWAVVFWLEKTNRKYTQRSLRAWSGRSKDFVRRVSTDACESHQAWKDRPLTAHLPPTDRPLTAHQDTVKTEVVEEASPTHRPLTAHSSPTHRPEVTPIYARATTTTDTKTKTTTTTEASWLPDAVAECALRMLGIKSIDDLCAYETRDHLCGDLVALRRVKPTTHLEDEVSRLVVMRGGIPQIATVAQAALRRAGRSFGERSKQPVVDASAPIWEQPWQGQVAVVADALRAKLWLQSNRSEVESCLQQIKATPGAGRAELLQWLSRRVNQPDNVLPMVESRLTA